MKLSHRLEDIFSHAVALQQSGRLRSTIYGIGRKVYVLNQDHTVLIRFRLRKTDRIEFDPPISFAANDYDSQLVTLEEGRICFTQEAGGFERVKKCKTPETTPQEIDKLFRSYPVDGGSHAVTVPLHREMLSLLDDSLSHIEFSCEDGEFRMVQRNIYSGTISEIKRKTGGGLVDVEDDLEDFEPIGLRTRDFMALFTFQSALDFLFLPEGFICVDSRDPKMPMRAIVSKCRYDELGTTE